ncbi:MAG TPA: gamma-glutamyl-gamma-aminobutyrate hydrolase family protein [Feifaniaceae bacterium]|nr:gamma-glutamyl-gamma-aminobutyrate hydrolase family protein [Feifaniaceae bacterium]
MKPVIGITPLYDVKKSSVWMLPGYMDGIAQAGGVPVILPLSAEDADVERLFRVIDGLLLSGGPDIDPSFYGEEKDEKCGEIDAMRDAVEQKYFNKAMSLDLPVFGICRGLQTINVLMGGTLYQDLPSRFISPNAENHWQGEPHDAPTHKVTLVQSSPLYALLETDKLPVNSYHHQGIRQLAPGLLPSAIAEDGLVEGIYAPHKTFVQAVQWHPEFCLKKDEPSRKIFRAFVNACAENN